MLEIKGLSLKDYLKTLKKTKAKEGWKMMLETFWGDFVYTYYDLKKIERLKKFPPQVMDNYILFETKNDFSGNGRIFYEYLIKNGYNKKYEIFWLVRNPEMLEKYKQDHVHFIRSHKKDDPELRNAASYKYLLRSRYIFYDQSVNWIGMTRKNQVFVNLWHGCDYAINADRKKIFFDYCLTPGQIYNLPMKQSFGCTMRKMLPLGYPYYDRIIQGSKGAEKYRKKLLKKSQSTRLVLWWPVIKRKIRKDELYRLNECCRLNQVQILIKNTTLEEKDKKLLTNIQVYKSKKMTAINMDVYELLHETDALISDYSAFLTDYLLLNRPMAYIMTELPETKKWAFEHYPDFLPGIHASSIEDICIFIQNLAKGEDDYRKKREETAEKIFDKCENYCQRIADYFLSDI